MRDIPDSTELGRASSYSSRLNEAGASQGSTGSGTVRGPQFPCCLSLLSPLCFHCRREGSVIKSPFLLLPLCLPASALDRLLSSCLPAAVGGGGVLAVRGGGGYIVAHRRLFYARLQEGQIQNQ